MKSRVHVPWGAGIGNMDYIPNPDVTSSTQETRSREFFPRYTAVVTHGDTRPCELKWRFCCARPNFVCDELRIDLRCCPCLGGREHWAEVIAAVVGDCF